MKIAAEVITCNVCNLDHWVTNSEWITDQSTLKGRHSRPKMYVEKIIFVNLLLVCYLTNGQAVVIHCKIGTPVLPFGTPVLPFEAFEQLWPYPTGLTFRILNIFYICRSKLIMWPKICLKKLNNPKQAIWHVEDKHGDSPMLLCVVFDAALLWVQHDKPLFLANNIL